MLTMQFKVILPKNYQMASLHDTVTASTPNQPYEGLKFGLHLIARKSKHDNIQNAYMPFYVWENAQAMNNFLLQGPFDQIIDNFGWHTIQTNSLLVDRTTSDVINMQYVIEYTAPIRPVRTLRDLELNIRKKASIHNIPEYMIVYNPTAWTYSIYYFTRSLLTTDMLNTTIYEIIACE